MQKLYIFIILTFSLVTSINSQSKINVLVFSKTASFRHESIGAGIKALDKMSREKGFNVTFTEDANYFTENNIKKFNTVIFLNTTGDVLNDEQQSVFERFIQAGGGYVGVHAATDTEYGWPWYGGLVGAYFLDHPSTPSNVQKGKFKVTLKNHWATKGLPLEFEHTDEFYSFKNISPKINVFMTIDETTYKGGSNPDYHPMGWYQEYDGGRSFYTAIGHTDEVFQESWFLNHLYGGIVYAAGGAVPKPLDYTKARPEENRFTKVVLEDKLDEPMEMTLLDSDRVLFIQRKGDVKLYNIRTKKSKTIATIPVSLKYVNASGRESVAEDGLLGLSKDPDFKLNKWVYIYYSSTKGNYNVLSRFTMRGDELVLSSEIEMLKVEVQREECCHTGGSIAWDKSGNLYLSTGDNTNPHASNGFSPTDERPGRSPWDAQKSSANTNDLRGKIIRIKPQPNGSYTIPEGNLFPEGTPKTRPEIYTMGHRNPFRISVDSKNNYLYWGDVGPDASKADPNRGPEGFCEIGQARKAGNFGWPHFIADNKAYHRYDFEKQQPGDKWNVSSPVNSSPNNNGLEVLPPAEKAFVWYPYAESKEFPLVGAGGRNPMAGPVYYRDMFPTAINKFPKYYDGKMFAYEWMRGWIMAITMDKNGDFVSMEKFMPGHKFSNPMDMEFAANGDLYMLEYGTGWFTANDDARLIKIEYNGGNRKPQLQLASDQKGGALPFNVKLTSDGTKDPDNDILTYSWKISSANGYSKTFTSKDVQLTLTKPGVYKATLTVSDGKGGISTRTTELIAGNEPPKLTMDMAKTNKSFYVANKSFDYEIKVSDKEDGSLGEGIDPENVSVNIDYLAEGYDKNLITMGHRSADANSAYAKGKKLVEAGTCIACHKKDAKSIGPAYVQVAAKYKGDSKAMTYLSAKIISGGSGVWGETAMAANPQLSKADATEMAKYILSLENQKNKDNALPLKGTFMTKAPDGDKNKGVYIVRTSYEDQGSAGLPSLRAEEQFVLRNSKVDPHGFDEYKDINKMAFGGMNLAIPTKSGASMILKQTDLTGVSEIQISATAPKPQVNAAGGSFEVRIGSPEGPLLGKSSFLKASETMDFTPKVISATVSLPKDMEGKLHDICLVFVNPEAGTNSLLVMRGLEFIMSYDTVVTENKSVTTAANDYFVGKWNTKVVGTPMGDIEMVLSIQRNNGVLTGQMISGQGAQDIDKIEETEPEKIKVYFKANGMNINMSLDKENEEKLKGKLMGMFDVSGNKMD